MILTVAFHYEVQPPPSRGLKQPKGHRRSTVEVEISERAAADVPVALIVTRRPYHSGTEPEPYRWDGASFWQLAMRSRGHDLPPVEMKAIDIQFPHARPAERHVDVIDERDVERERAGTVSNRKRCMATVVAHAERFISLEGRLWERVPEPRLVLTKSDHMGVSWASVTAEIHRFKGLSPAAQTHVERMDELREYQKALHPDKTLSETALPDIDVMIPNAFTFSPDMEAFERIGRSLIEAMAPMLAERDSAYFRTFEIMRDLLDGTDRTATMDELADAVDAASQAHVQALGPKRISAEMQSLLAEAAYVLGRCSNRRADLDQAVRAMTR